MNRRILCLFMMFCACASCNRSPAVHPTLESAYSSVGKEQEAVRHYGEAIRFDPSEVVFYLNRGANLVDLGKYDEAIEDFSAAIALAPDDYRPYALRYNAYIYNGEIDKARQDGKVAHRLNPEWSMPKSVESASGDDTSNDADSP